MKALLCGCFAFCLMCAAMPVAGQVVSDFSVNDEGWTIADVGNGNATAVTYNATGGNPGGYISFTTGTSIGLFWRAPAKFLGGHCLNSYGQNLKFDLQLSAAGAVNSSTPPYGSLRLTGSGVTITLAVTAPAISPGWTTYSIRLDETTAWHTNVTSGTLSTRTEIITALSNLNKIEIVAQAQSAADPETRLDNIVLETLTLQTPPAIANVTPLTGVPGLTDITITGTGFNATPSLNLVYFGGVQTVPSAATPTQLTVRVPVGAQYYGISVVNQATGLSATTSTPFLPRFDNNKDYGGQIIRASMAPPVALPTASYQGWLEAADIDGDGRNDLIVSESPLRTFTVSRNISTTGSITNASFQTPVSFNLGTTDSKGYLAVGDFDGDGKIDVAVSSATSLGYASVSVFRNTSTVGSISFQAPLLLTGYSYSDGPLAVADMDGDGRLDILCIFNNSCGTNQMYIFPNRSTPGTIDFCAYTGFPVYSCGGGITVADLDGDKKPDVVVDAGQVNIFRNTSTFGSIAMAPAFLLASNASGKPVIADLDNDGKNDIAWQNGTTKVEIHKNLYTTGTFDATAFSTPILVEGTLNNTSGLRAGDINGDGKIDLLSSGTTDFTILQSVVTTGTLTTSSFLPGTTFRGDNYTFASPHLVDFDGDNKVEFMVRAANFALPSTDWLVYIYHNESYPVPRIDSYSPTGGTVGTNITLTGDYMKTGTGTPLTRMAGLVSSSTTSSNTTTATVVPLGAKTGKFSLTEHGLTGYSKPFNLVFGTSKTIDATSFATRVDFAMTTAAPRDGLEIADFDDDGKTDVVVGEGSGTLKIFQNTHATPGLPITTSSLTLLATPFTSVYNFVALDVDGDGKIDLNTGGGLLKNSSTPGSISFLNGPGGVSTVAAAWNQAVPADLNKDGKTDMVVVNGGVTLQLYQNSSTTAPFTNDAFSPFANVGVSPTRPANYGGVVVADFDGDGFEDLASANTNTDNFSTFRNLGVYGPLNGTNYGVAVNTATGDQPYNLTVSDFDNDGKMDLAVVHYNTLFVSVYRNTSNIGSISFAAPVNLTCLTRGYNITSQDLDGDGLAEIVMIHQPNPGPGSFTVFQNKSTSGTITFAAGINTVTPTHNPAALNITDVNGDLKPDILIVGGSTTGSTTFLMVFENRITAPINPPVITSFTPASALQATSVTINGNNFGTTPALNTVYFNGMQATVTSASATQLVVTVPPYAGFGPLTVENLTTHLSGISLSNFTPVFDNNKDFGGRIIPASMGLNIDINIGTSDAADVRIADLDGDGFPDLIVPQNDTLSIFHSKGNNVLGAAGFEAKIKIGFDDDGNHIARVIDMDGDGKLDIVMMTRGPGDTDAAMIYRNISTPGSLSAASFAAPVIVKLPFLTINNADLAVADLNADGKPELILEASGKLSVFANQSTPGNLVFAGKLDIAGVGSRAISVGDIDGDGLLDLAVAGGYYGAAGFQVVHNRSTGGSLFFDAPITFSPTGTGNFNNVNLADLDNDGKLDVSWVGPLASGGLGLHIMKNIATAGSITSSSLAPDVTIFWSNGAIGAGNYSEVADINGDGKVDVIGTGSIAGGLATVGIFENLSQSGILNASSFLEGVEYHQVFNWSSELPTVGDLDGDGKPEIIVANFSYVTHILSIYHNECFPAPRIDLIKNSSGATTTGIVGTDIFSQGDFQFTDNSDPTFRFGAVNATVSSSTNILVSSTIPAGATYERASMTEHNLTAFSQLPFSTLFSTTGSLDINTFATRVDYSLTTSNTRAVAVADFDNDGNPDIAAGDGGNIRLFRSALPSPGSVINATTFTTPAPLLTAGISTLPIALGDFDGDGLVDIQGAGYALRNNSGTQATPASFETAVYINSGGPSRGRTNIDFNHDGKTDIITLNTSGNVIISGNTTRTGSFTTGAFSSFTQLTIGVGPLLASDPAAGDFDGDGYDDIAFLRNSTNQLQFMLNNGLNRAITAAQFGALQSTATLASPSFMTSADFDQDGKLDLAVTYTTIGSVSVFKNTSTVGSVSFTRIDLTSLPNLTGIEVGDLDGDGKPEIVTISAGTFSIFKNTSSTTISFAPAIDNELPSTPTGIAIADLNLDSRPDILISRAGPYLSLFQNALPSGNTITVTQQPVDKTVCVGVNGTFTMDATGTTNLAFKWQYALTGAGPFVDIADGTGYSGTGTKTLTVHTTGNFGAGRYRGRITGDFALPVFTSDEGLFINTCTANLPPVIASTSGSTVIGGTVSVDLSSLVSDPDNNLDLSTLSVVVQPSSGAIATIDASHNLSINYQGLAFSGTDKLTIQVCDLSGACVQKQIEIIVSGSVIVYNAVSTNGDGKNEALILQFVEILPETQNNHVTIYNRWGDEVFSIGDYNNTSRVFNGSSSDGKPLPSGTYFYKVVFASGAKSLLGYLELKR